MALDPWARASSPRNVLFLIALLRRHYALVAAHFFQDTIHHIMFCLLLCLFMLCIPSMLSLSITATRYPHNLLCPRFVTWFFVGLLACWLYLSHAH
jgi:hypothetical protein